MRGSVSGWLSVFTGSRRLVQYFVNVSNRALDRLLITLYLLSGDGKGNCQFLIYNVIIVSYRSGGGSERELLLLWRGCLVVITSVGGIYSETLIIIVFG